jgi:pimeloyl-ACP methyl ester carboxylesterase
MLRILTIHGICTLGEWQEEVEQEFAPFFECIPLKYPQYRRWGALKVVFGLRKKRQALSHILGQIKRATAGSAIPPHLIAHSFGTVLSGEVIKRHPWLRLGRVVFVGSVLPAYFPWSRLLTEDPDKITELRNEVGRRDSVVGIAGLASVFQKGLGLSGLVGFKGRSVQTLDGPLQGCDVRSGTPRGSSLERIFNAPLSEYSHRTVFLSARHFTDLWLPFFWGYAPCDYLRFLRLCELVKEFEQDKLTTMENEARNDLYGWKWPWSSAHDTSPRFREYMGWVLATELKKANRSLSPRIFEKATSLAVDGVCEAIVTGLRERAKKPAQRNLDRLKALYPPYAVSRAIEKTIERSLP